MNVDILLKPAELQAKEQSSQVPTQIRIWLKEDEDENEYKFPKDPPKVWVLSENESPDDKSAKLMQVWESGKLTWNRLGLKLFKVQKIYE